jgi:hypothetical protein
MINTFCIYHLGDQITHLNFMRKVIEREPSISWTHAMPAPYLAQMNEVVADLPQIKLISLDDKPSDAIDIWKNRAGDFWQHPKRNDWLAYHIEFFDKLARDLGLESPMQEADDFLFDYPAIADWFVDNEYECPQVLVINSQPMSGQMPQYSADAFVGLVDKLRERYSVRVTQTLPHRRHDDILTHPLTLSQIGGLSIASEYIIGVATGPIWPTFNIWNRDTAKLRVLMLEPERVNIAPNTEHADCVERAVGILMEHGVL